VNALLLLLALLCHMLPLLFRISGASASLTAVPTLQLSRASSIVMLVAYITYIIFQLVTHRQLFEAQEVINWSNYSFPSEWCDQIKSLKRHKIKMYLKFLQDRLAEILITWRNSSGYRRR
jgi:Ca2+/H+ antiporter